MATFTRAAFITSARHLNGSVVCKAADGLPFLLREGQTAHFVPPTFDAPRNARVASIEDIKPDSWAVHFDGVDSPEAAEALNGCYCLVADDELPELAPEDHPGTLVGFAVTDDVFGDLGKVAFVQGTPAQATLEIEGPRGSVLVPLVDEFVVELDADARAIRTSIPTSLLVLNSEEEA